jgi:tryptophan synthase alpha subunit
MSLTLLENAISDSNKKTFSAAQQYANGAIIGSKFVRLTAECANAKEAIIKLKEALQK